MTADITLYQPGSINALGKPYIRVIHRTSGPILAMKPNLIIELSSSSHGPT